MLARLNNALSLCVLVVFQILPHSIQAATDDSYVLSGTLNMDSHDTFLKALGSNKIKTVILRDCDGGNLAVGLMLAKSIKDNQINTMASGRVISACALAYLGGVSRGIDTLRNDNGIMFHGGINILTGEPAGVALNLSALKLLFEFTNFKFKKAIEDIILNTKSDDEGAVFLRFQDSGKIRDVTIYCPADSKMKPEKCKKLDAITLESEGIVTK